MTLVRFECEQHLSHDPVLVEVPSALAIATAEQIEVACPECNHEMDYNIVGGL